MNAAMLYERCPNCAVTDTVVGSPKQVCRQCAAHTGFVPFRSTVPEVDQQQRESMRWRYVVWNVNFRHGQYWLFPAVPVAGHATVDAAVDAAMIDSGFTEQPEQTGG